MHVSLAACVVLVVAALAAGCGGDEPVRGASDATTRMPAVERDDQQIREITDRFLRSLAENYPAGACDVLAPSERRLARRDYGKCEWSFGDLVGPTSRTLRTDKIEVTGDGASIVIVDEKAGSLGPVLFAVRVDGEWGITRKAEYKRVVGRP